LCAIRGGSSSVTLKRKKGKEGSDTGCNVKLSEHHLPGFDVADRTLERNNLHVIFIDVLNVSSISPITEKQRGNQQVTGEQPTRNRGEDSRIIRG
jgi:hypothetical protein